MIEDERQRKIKALQCIVYTIEGLMGTFMCKVENPWLIDLDAMSNGAMEK